MLENKVALVTGASRGIGRAIALRLAKDGAAVIVNYNGSKEKAEAVVKEIEEAGGKAEAYQCSVADFAGVEEMMKYVIKTYGRIDILVNNAGITRDGLLMAMSEADFDAVIDTNLKGAFNCMRHVARQMIKQRGGRIINIFLHFRCDGKCRADELRRIQGRRHRHDQDGCQGAGRAGHHGERHRPGFITTDMTDVLSDSVKEGLLAQIP